MGEEGALPSSVVYGVPPSAPDNRTQPQINVLCWTTSSPLESFKLLSIALASIGSGRFGLAFIERKKALF